MQVNKDPVANALLSLLAYDNNVHNHIIPSMECFRSQEFSPVPLLSTKRVSDVADINTFSFSFDEPSKSERKDMAVSLRQDLINSSNFLHGCSKRTNKLMKSKLKNFDGSALWILGSFMNHSSKPTAIREFFGKMMFVHAAVPFKAGDEVTTTYSDD